MAHPTGDPSPPCLSGYNVPTMPHTEMYYHNFLSYLRGVVKAIMLLQTLQGRQHATLPLASRK
jgi:hypothetical protein